jgi:hypothetical protein
MAVKPQREPDMVAFCASIKVDGTVESSSLHIQDVVIGQASFSFLSN